MKVSHLEENVAAVNIALSQEEFAALDHEGKTRSQRRAAVRLIKSKLRRFWPS
jgi:diketogulonate reductase-like aldo/keto reductase